MVVVLAVVVVVVVVVNGGGVSFSIIFGFSLKMPLVPIVWRVCICLSIRPWVHL